MLNWISGLAKFSPKLLSRIRAAAEKFSSACFSIFANCRNAILPVASSTRRANSGSFWRQSANASSEIPHARHAILYGAPLLITDISASSKAGVRLPGRPLAVNFGPARTCTVLVCAYRLRVLTVSVKEVGIAANPYSPRSSKRAWRQTAGVLGPC